MRLIQYSLSLKEVVYGLGSKAMKNIFRFHKMPIFKGEKMRKKWMATFFGMLLLVAGTGLAQEGYVHLSPQGWDTWDGSVGFNIYGGGGGTTCYVLKTTTTEYLSKPVQFHGDADGNLVRQITISYKDNDATNNIHFYLRNVDLYDQSVTTVASLESSGSSSSWRRMYINRWDMAARRINNERYAWYVIVHFENTGSVLQLGNIKIKWATD